MPKNLADSMQPITSQVVVYAPADKAEKLLKFLLYPGYSSVGRTLDIPLQYMYEYDTTSAFPPFQLPVS
jgi:hypothetical protein